MAGRGLSEGLGSAEVTLCSDWPGCEAGCARRVKGSNSQASTQKCPWKALGSSTPVLNRIGENFKSLEHCTCRLHQATIKGYWSVSGRGEGCPAFGAYRTGGSEVLTTPKPTCADAAVPAECPTRSARSERDFQYPLAADVVIGLFCGHLVLGSLRIAIVPYLFRQRTAVAVLPALADAPNNELKLGLSPEGQA